MAPDNNLIRRRSFTNRAGDFFVYPIEFHVHDLALYRVIHP